MGRPRAFDEDVALDAAVSRFWSHGYAGTTVRDLEAAMGLGSASFYNAFGDKQALFARCLQRYLDGTMRARMADCEDRAPLDAISDFLFGIVERSLEDRRGCLLVNTAIELAPHEAAFAGTVAQWLRELEAFFARCIRRGQADGSIGPQRDADDLARLLVSTVLGLRVMARGSPDRALLEGVARQALSLLPPGAQDTCNPRSRSNGDTP
ncbi:TetR/AcrR family transcriptional regulator [Futiania mangrovi]|uniref:TetR/AcrR family transcriptional regulator n=1 Tax=Futiania mangrovi TaxID=2959716 RepID=A0A9J6PCZ2_9PROT|nr:TetR/AcrR family transcriptional regulator [Futiania mangrovii]MCP1335539.1 TetR/AcrR family transcriptional regulator [Futiania mangrovii]